MEVVGVLEEAGGGGGPRGCEERAAVADLGDFGLLWLWVVVCGGLWMGGKWPSPFLMGSRPPPSRSSQSK